MIGIFKQKSLCSCMHPRRWHKENYLLKGACRACLTCDDNCSGKVSLSDNLKYVEYVEKMRKEPWKRILALVIDIPLSVWAAIKRFQERHTNSWGEFFVVSFFCLCAAGLASGFLYILLQGIIFQPQEKAKKQREHLAWVVTSLVKCYSGNRLLYEGKVLDIEYTGAFVKIMTYPAKKEYLCNGFEREERTPNRG
jgi:hypothetical protein